MNVVTWYPSEASHNLSPRMIDSRRVSIRLGESWYIHKKAYIIHVLLNPSFFVVLEFRCHCPSLHNNFLVALVF